MAGKKNDPVEKLRLFMRSWEEKNWVKRTPAFLHDYAKNYPQFSILEENYEVIRKECEALLDIKDDITDMDGLVGNRTAGGIHAVKWKTFMFKTGSFIEENCALCPETAKLLKKIPGIRNTFFSILDPNQHILPHRGSYNGFLRYHLGVIIPDNNKDNKCWIRINDDVEDNRRYDKSTMHKGETYYWKNGAGIMFNDNYLHEANNETDQIRVVLFIDVIRKYPHIFGLFNKLIIAIGYQTSQLKKMAKRAVVKPKQVEAA